VPIELPQGPCIFCERIAGEGDTWAVIDEDELTLAVINPRQYEEGQALVVPRRHAPTVLDLTETEAAALMLQVQRVSRAIVAAFDPDGITIYQNNGVASLQAIPHSHFHVVPRRYGSGWGEGPPHLAAITRADREKRFRRDALPIERLAELAERIKARLPLQPL
jgi:histidine triad (HIT) family protein